MDAIKGMLDSLTQATCLVIKFHKSTLVPMHADPNCVAMVRRCPWLCTQSVPSKLPLPPALMQQAEPGCLCSSDREGHTYLSGWLAVLLSVGGRLIIINSVFDTVPFQHTQWQPWFSYRW
jgi:hypothetical protein